MKVKSLVDDFDMTKGNIYRVVYSEHGDFHSETTVVYVRDDKLDVWPLWPDEYEIVEE